MHSDLPSPKPAIPDRITQGIFLLWLLALLFAVVNGLFVMRRVPVLREESKTRDELAAHRTPVNPPASPLLFASTFCRAGAPPLFRGGPESPAGNAAWAGNAAITVRRSILGEGQPSRRSMTTEPC